MKRLASIVLGGLLVASLPALAQSNASKNPNSADKQWLTAVKKMVVEGQSTVSTPSEERVTLLKDWATKEGYSAKVTKTEKGFRVSLAKSLAKN